MLLYKRRYTFLQIFHRTFSRSESPFEIAAVLVSRLCSGEVDGAVPYGGSAGRRGVEGMFRHGRLVELSSSEALAGPILVEQI